MKKSKFLKSSKDLLSRSFNPSKCKTSLRLAESRLKLLRNKKEVQVKQMKREIAQLLESGQDHTARIRVEHVIREEKMMAAYDLTGIYCELLIARLPIIESQKTCPIDLKEAIASVVFASPRFGDVPELLDVRKHLTIKYGKDFTTAAVELRPECGVSRMLVEKLSAMAPDGQTKIKVLTAIAEEHNVKWEPKSFGEKDSDPVPPSDSLTGPSTFAMAGKPHVEPTRFEDPDVQVPGSDSKMHDSPLNFSQLDHRTSLGTEKSPSGPISGVSTAFPHELRPPGNERAQLFQRVSMPLDRQRWNMEFKDATSAAQAAAESAELASVAARAAAELSSRGRIMRQYSTESHKSDVHVLNDGKPEIYADSKLASEQFEELNRSFSKYATLRSEQINGMSINNQKTDERFIGGGHGRTKEYSQSASLKSRASTYDDSLNHGGPVVDGYSGKNSFKEVSRGEISMQRESFKYRAESANGRSEKSENVREERIGKQPSVKSAHSHASAFNDVNIFSDSLDQKVVYDAGKASIHGEASKTSSRESAAPVFDNSDSDSDTHGFDMGPTYDEQEPGFHFPLSSQKPRENLSTNIDLWSPRSRTSKIVDATSVTATPFLNRKNSCDFPEHLRSTDGSKLDDSMPRTFGESDGTTSESDEDMNMSRYAGISGGPLSKQNQSVGSQFMDNRQSVGSPVKAKGSSGFDRNQFSLSSDDEMKSEELDGERNQRKNFAANPPAKFSPGKPSANQPALEPESEGLNFGKLTGGFRHKGYNWPPYLKNQVDVPSSFNKESEETTTTITRSIASSAVDSPSTSKMSKHKKSIRTPDIQSEPDSDSSEEEESLWKSSDHKRQPYTLSAGKEVKLNSRLAGSNSAFSSANSDLDYALPKESTARTVHLQSGISRGTKVSPSSGTKNYSKMQLRSDDFNEGIDRRPTTSNASGTSKKSESQRNSSKWENYEQPTSATVTSKPTNSNSWGTQNRYSFGKPNSVTTQESKITAKSSAVEESIRPPSKTESSVISENHKAATPNKTPSNKDDRNQKASHVHPKLPDYDTLVQTLRQYRS
ncbi:Spindle pole body protein [Handroanthus impetiginosus]|uniref:Spindle pole body protein n=1 Tax=Handroanthus impetiginosus TaxID=429701 RepID=A0A2G9FYX4_9LAMI|nr:Spindle pole body protein [Handroanthus impetiginosus]